MEKHSVSRLSYLFAHLPLLSSDLFSSDSSHLCFSTVHIVGSFTSKLPSTNNDKTKQKRAAREQRNKHKPRTETSTKQERKQEQHLPIRHAGRPAGFKICTPQTAHQSRIVPFVFSPFHLTPEIAVLVIRYTALMGNKVDLAHIRAVKVEKHSQAGELVCNGAKG